jgi:hypothetical protein
MTKLLAQAFEQIARLPEPEQEAIAALLLDELASERRWDEAFNRSPDTLAGMADQALTEHREGCTKPLE